MNLIRDIGRAMDEAVDQRAIVLYPPNQEWEYRVTRAHADLAAAHKTGAILTIPLQAAVRSSERSHWSACMVVASTRRP